MDKIRCVLRFLIAITILLGFRCRDGGDPIEPPFKDPRSLTWSADTISAPYTPQTLLGTLWGSAANNVYLSGWTSNGAVLYKYDGSTWNLSSMARSARGQYEIQLVRGFSSSDIWFLGAELFYNFSPPPNFFDSSLILHFDGSTWTQIAQTERGRRVEKMCATSPQDFIVAGEKTLWSFRYGSWTKDTIPVVTSSLGSCAIYGLALDRSGVLYVTFYYRPIDAGPVEQYYFLSRANNQWSLLDSAVIQPGNVENRWGYDDLWISPAGELYSIGYGIYKWTGTGWTLIYPVDYNLIRITGTNSAGILAVGGRGTLLHFNGTNWYQFKQLRNDNVQYTDVWTDGKEVFIAGYQIQGGQSIILHGR